MSYTVSRHTIEHQRLPRSYTLVTPQNGAPDTALLYFHGSLQSSNVARNFTGNTFDKLTARNILVAYPDGIHHHFNDARRDLDERTRTMRVDDVGFITRLVSTLIDDHRINPAKVFGCGFSNGGQMVLRLLHDTPGLFAGAATFAATMPTEDNFSPTIGHPDPVPTPFLSIHGTADPISPYLGGEVGIDDKKRGAVRSLLETGEYFAAINGFSPDERVHENYDDGIIVDTFRGGGRPPVQLWSVRGMGHLVPSPKALHPRLGEGTEAFTAAEVTADFFGF